MPVIADSSINSPKSDSSGELGFTVIEIITVIAIVGILTGIAVVRFSSTSDALMSSTANMMISNIAYAQEIARLHHIGTEVSFYSDGEGDDANTYTLRYQDGSWITKPHDGENFIVDLGEVILITSSDMVLEFDSSGKLTTPGASWTRRQESMIIVELNESVNIMIARFTGTTWIE